MPLIERYREIECVASEMLAAGRAGDWTRVGDLGTTIRSLADGVARAGGPEALDPGQQMERLQIMKRLVVLDGELRRLADPTNGWLDAMFGTAPGDGAAPHDGSAPRSA
ncbi:MAG: flagellar protein FliT [Burkholderiales bacterium]|nr:flagellar protein FliT [Burkholderiales bacterium]OJX09099.1 MAG: hypothetical protein BGO72_19540 [Burkholderiales bacterium 70-64]